MNFKWNGFKFASEFQINSVHHNHSNFVGLHFKFCKIFLWVKCIDTFHIFTIFQFIRVSIYMRKWKKNSFSSFCDIKEWGQRGGTEWEIEIEIMEFVKLKYLNIHGASFCVDNIPANYLRFSWLVGERSNALNGILVREASLELLYSAYSALFHASARIDAFSRLNACYAMRFLFRSSGGGLSSNRIF